MPSVPTKDLPKTPKTLLSIIVYVGGLALFLIIASTFLVSQPIGTTVRGYFYGVDRSRESDSELSLSLSVPESNNPSDEQGKSTDLSGLINSDVSQHLDAKSGKGYDSSAVIGENHRFDESSKGSKDELRHSKEAQEGDGNRNSSWLHKSPQVNALVPFDNVQTEVKERVESSPETTNLSQANVVDSGCDLYLGKWIHDATGPLYTNNSCPVITQMQNCQGNGRPDKDYENWRWKPSQCDLPRFDARKFLELMRGKTIAFVGDSVARNQMESMLCILWQVEEPKNKGNRKIHRYYFRSTSTTIVRLWSSWLVHQTSEPFDFAPAGVVKLNLDIPDETFMEYIMGFDVMVLNSGHWFVKQSVFILNNEIVGGQLWWPDKSRPKKIDNIEAFGVSVETVLTALGAHPNYTGITILRSYSPDHYEGGAWNTGGSCTGKVKPIDEIVENGFTNIMHEKQVTGFNRAIKKKTNKSKLKLMDITEAFAYRHDGHPGPYRSPDPNKITARGPDGRPPPQDCLHWCMPGAVDTWNEIVFEIIRREFHGGQSVLS